MRARLERGLERGYEELLVLTPVELAGADPERGRARCRPAASPCSGAGERFAMLLERIDRALAASHDFGGSANALLAGFVRRIDRLKAELIGAEDYARWAARLAESEPRQRSSASSPRSTAPTSGCWPRPARATPAT